MKAYLSRSGKSPRVIIKDGRKQLQSKSFPGLGGLAKAKIFAEKFNEAEDRAKALAINGAIPIDLMLGEFWEKRVCMLSPGYQSHATRSIDQCVDRSTQEHNLVHYGVVCIPRT